MGVISRLWPARWPMNQVVVLAGFPSLPQPMWHVRRRGGLATKKAPVARAQAQVVAEKEKPPARRKLTIEEVLADFSTKWSRGESPRVEQYVSSFSEADSALLVELVYHEYCLAKAAGLAPDPARYLARFPAQSERLSRLFELDHALDDSRLLGRLIESASLPSAGDEVGPYRLLRELGRGGFSRVFLAEQADLENRLIVVKVTNRPSSEPRLLARLGHPHIAEVIRQAEVDDGALQLVCMPFRGGATLMEVLTRQRERGRRTRSAGRQWVEDLDKVAAPEGVGLSTGSNARQILRQGSHAQAAAWVVARVAEALDHAQKRGISHGDLKPSNVLIAADGCPMLLDFNLSVDWRQVPGDATGDVGGTLAYMSLERLQSMAAQQGQPESIRPLSARARHRADIYSLGLILLECLTGEPPAMPADRNRPASELARDLQRLRSESGDWLSRSLKKVPRGELRRVVKRCLETDPADRYSTSAQVAEELEAYRARSDERRVARTWWSDDSGSMSLNHGRVRARALVLAAVLVVGGSLAYAAHATREAFRHEASAKLESVWGGSHEEVFGFVAFGKRQALTLFERGVAARRHLDAYRVIEDADWFERRSVSMLGAEQRDDLLLWQMEQAWCYGSMVLGEPDIQPAEVATSLIALDHASQGCFPGPLRDLAERLRSRSQGSSTAVDPRPMPRERAWMSEYLEAVALEAEQSEGSLDLYRQVYQKRGKSFWVNYRLACDEWRDGRYQKAVEHLSVCLQAYPENVRLLIQRAGLLCKVDQPALALADIERALRIEPTNSDARHTLAVVRGSLQQVIALKDELEAFSRMVKQRRTNDEWVKLFDAWRLIGLEVAVQGSNLGLDPERLRGAAVDDLNTRFVLALSLRDLKRTDEAIEQLDSILEADSAQLWPRYVRGVIQWKRGELDAARADFSELIKHREFGQLMVEDSQAVSLYRFVASHLTNGREYVKAMDVLDRGRNHIRQYLEIHPDAPEEVKNDLWGYYHYSLARCLAASVRETPDFSLPVMYELMLAMSYLPGSIPRAVLVDLPFSPYREGFLFFCALWK